MLKTKKFTIIFTFFVLISLFGTSFTNITVFAQAEESVSDSFSENTAEPPAPSAPLSSDLPQYNLYDIDTLHSAGVFMVNLNTNIIVCSKNPDERLVPASLTKIMTALVCFEKIRNFSQVVECPYLCFDEFWTDNLNYRGASTAGIATKQDNLTYTDCLYALMLPSGCEAANILAYNVAGDIPTFVGMMNELAQKIGCKNTHFSNPHGLYDEENYTSARDMYLIARYAIDTYPGFMNICESTSYQMPPNIYDSKGAYVTTTNQMMRTNSSYYYEGVKGIKTGSIGEFYVPGEKKPFDTTGTKTLVTTCEKDGYKYLLVTLGAPYNIEDENTGKTVEKQYHYDDHTALYDWAFSEFEYARVVGKNEFVMTAPVDLGYDTDEIELVTNDEYYTLLPKIDGAESIVQKIKPEVKEMTAPINERTFVGNLQLVMGNEVVAEIPLVTSRYVAVDQNELYRRKIEEIVKSPVFIISVSAVVLLIIAIIVIRIVVKAKQKEQRARRKVSIQSSSQKNVKKPKDRRR